MRLRLLALTLGISLTALGMSCSSSDDTSGDTAAPTTTEAAPATTVTTASAAAGTPVTFTAEVWADNWFSLTVNGEAVGEDSVPITTERSFNAETIEFEATYPLTLGVVSKDFKETESGLEYIGTDRQQMGDGGLIAQVTDLSTGEVVATTDTSWRLFVVNRAPLDTACESAADPDATCEHETVDVPDAWSGTAFDDSGWDRATGWTADDVAPKDGYDQITWDDSAQLIWGDDLEVVNTILVRTVVTG